MRSGVGGPYAGLDPRPPIYADPGTAGFASSVNHFRAAISSKFGAYGASSTSRRAEICREFDSWLPRVGVNGIVVGLFGAPVASFEHDLQHVNGQWAYNKATAVLGIAPRDYYKIVHNAVKAIQKFELKRGGLRCFCLSSQSSREAVGGLHILTPHMVPMPATFSCVTNQNPRHSVATLRQPRGGGILAASCLYLDRDNSSTHYRPSHSVGKRYEHLLQHA